MRKIMCNNPNLDIVNINSYTKFGKVISFHSQDNERKRNSERNSDITLLQKRENDV